MDMLLKKFCAFAQNTFKEMKSMKRLWDDEEPTINDEKKEMATFLIWMPFSKAHALVLDNASMTNLGAHGISSWP